MRLQLHRLQALGVAGTNFVHFFGPGLFFGEGNEMLAEMFSLKKTLGEIGIINIFE